MKDFTQFINNIIIEELHPCAFTIDSPLHKDIGIVRVSLPNGCICYPQAREQWLCHQHYNKMDVNGVEHTILEDLRE